MRIRWLATAALLVLAGCAGSTGSSAPATAPGPTPTVIPSLSVTLADFKIEPSSLSVSETILTVAVTSSGPTPHNFTIRDAADQRVAGTEDLSTGESTTLTAELEAGEYTFFCALAGHESLGMRGTLTVRSP